jgi:predicted membrane channel-forming protein YqfA (hemolysin III family)
MDYRHYRGDGVKIPAWLHRHAHKLRRLGVILLLAGISLPWLILIKLLKSSFFLNILAYSLILLGPILYLIGMVFDNLIDRSQ